jgi:N-acetylmuramoyl-L-alanine amidase
MDQRDSPYPPTAKVMRHLLVSLVVAGALATIFTAWTPATLRPGELVGQLLSAFDEPSPGSQPLGGAVSEPGALRIGIVIGHAGPHPDTGLEDPGSICSDGLTELEVNQTIANLVARSLEAAGFEADILDEWDERLYGYRAVALVSIHADSCLPINEFATGFKITAAVDTAVQDKAQRLVACVVDRYQRATGLRYHEGSITRDMTEYHTFREVHSQTPAVIIETGFLYLDRDLLTGSPEKAARGIAEGVLCYINNEPINLGVETP